MFKEKSGEILHLQKELINLSTKFANEKERLLLDVEKKDSKINDLMRLNEILDQSKKAMENKNNAQQQIILDQEEKIDKQGALITSLTDKNKDINETVKKENKSLQAQNTDLESKVSQLKNESDTQIKQLENQLKQQQAELKQAEEKNAEFRKKLESAQQQLVQKNTDLTNQLKDLSSKLHAAEIKKKELEDEVNELKEKAKGKDAEVENLKQQLEKEKDELKDSSSKLNATETEKKDLEGGVKELKEKLQILEKNSAKIEKQKTDLEKKLEFSQGKNKKLQKQVEHPSAKKTENITTFSTRNNKEIPNQSLTSKDKQTEVSRPESGQQKLKNELKDASKKPEDINKETKALDAKSMLSTTKSITKSTFSKVKNKLLGNEDLNNFLSKENKELKKSFPELEGKHFCHIVLKKTIQSLLCQNSYKFKSDQLLELLETNLKNLAREIIEDLVKKVVTRAFEQDVKKNSVIQVSSVQKCAKELYLNEEDSKAILNSFTGFLANRNDSNNDSVKEFIVKELIKAEMKCFSYKIQGLQLASSIRDKFLSTDEKMCIKISGKNNEYRLTEKAKEEYKLTLPLTPNSSMSHTTTSNIQGLVR